MGELEDTADHLVIVGRGKVIADTGTAQLLARASGGRLMVRTAAATRQRRSWPAPGRWSRRLGRRR